MSFDASVWGTVGEWVASTVAMAALVFAVVTASRAHRAQQRAERRYEDRVMSEQARRIRWTLFADGLEVHIRNLSDAPVTHLSMGPMDVSWKTFQLDREGGRIDRAQGEATVILAVPEVPAGENGEMHVLRGVSEYEPYAGHTKVTYEPPPLEFTDVQGRRWQLTHNQDLSVHEDSGWRRVER